ncbi:hypothetical protein [Devosia sp.]|jgi:hypothetical protein|uniref:hypothetical protein n=1 Tax=Devosia sp. TaxID=1871048 RepID=UPI0037BF86AC
MTRIFLPLLTTALLAIAAQPARATEWLDCISFDFKQRLQLLAGGVDFRQFSAATLYVNGVDWSTSPEAQPGQPLDIGQAFWDGETLLVDLIDPAAQSVLAELRVFATSEGADDVKGGVLRVPGTGAWVVVCSGP